jgi:hypothetical protein
VRLRICSTTPLKSIRNGGSVFKFTGVDGSGEIAVIVWGKLAEEISKEMQAYPTD